MSVNQPFRQRINTMDTLRLVLFLIWVLFGLILTLMPLFLLKQPSNDINTSDILSVMKLLVGLWLPEIVCFSAFWFRQDHRKQSDLKPPNSAQWIAAILSTLLYFCLCLLFIGLSIFQPQTHDPNFPEIKTSPGIKERVADIEGWLVLTISPLTTLIIGRVTGHPPNEQ